MAWLLALSGCAFVWRIDEVPAPPIDATGDATHDSAGSMIDSSIDSPADAPMCQAGFFHEDFTSTTPCNPWAMTFGLSGMDTLTQGAGKLDVNKQSAGSTGCEATGAIAFDKFGVFVAIDQVMQNGFTVLMLPVTSDMSGTRWSITIHNGSISLEYNGVAQVSVTYDAVGMKYVRLRPGGAGMIADYSSDAAHWTELGQDAHTPPMMLYVALLGYEATNVGMSETASFSHLNTCP